MEDKKPKNKLYTKSYTVKRLIEEGFVIEKLNIKYPKEDIRYWTILIDPGVHNIFLTCYLPTNKDEFYFKLTYKNTLTIKTKSLNVLSDAIRNLIHEE